MDRFNNNDIQVEAENGTSLNEGSLVDRANRVLDSNASRLESLAPEYASRMKSNIIAYWRSAANRFDTNATDGLNTVEFDAYATAMITKLEESIADYAPTQAEAAEAQQAAENAEQAEANLQESMEAVTSIDIADSSALEQVFSPENLSDPAKLSEAIGVFQTLNGQVAQEVQTLNQAIADFTNDFNNLQESRRTLQGTWGRVFGFGRGEVNDNRYNRDGDILVDRNGNPISGEGSVMTMQDGSTRFVRSQRSLEQIKNELITTLEAKQAELASKETDYNRYGTNLTEASDNLVSNAETERDEQLRALGANDQQLEDARNMHLTQNVEAIRARNELIARREELVRANEEIELARLDASSTAQDLSGQQELVQRSRQATLDSYNQVKDALQNPENLSSEQITQLEQAKAELEVRLEELGFSEQQLIEQESGVWSQVSDLDAASLNATTSLTNIDGLRENVDNSISTLNTAIEGMSGQQTEIQDQIGLVSAHYAEQISAFREMDMGIEDAVFESKMAAVEAFITLPSQIEYLKNTDVTRSALGVLWDGTVGLAGAGLRSFAEVTYQMASSVTGKIETLPWYGQLLLAPISVNFYGLQIATGAVDAVGVMAESFDDLFTADGMRGLGALIGRDPQTGEYSWSTFGNTLGVVGYSMVGGDYYSNGRALQGIGAGAFNIVSTLAGVGSVRAGASVASATLRTGGSLGRAFGNGVGVASRSFGDDIARLARFGVDGALDLGRGSANVFRGTSGWYGSKMAGLQRIGTRAATTITKSTDELTRLGVTSLDNLASTSLDDFLRALPEGVNVGKAVRQFNRFRSASDELASTVARREALTAFVAGSPDDMGRLSRAYRLSRQRGVSMLDSMREIGRSLSGAARQRWNAMINRFVKNKTPDNVTSEAARSVVLSVADDASRLGAVDDLVRAGDDITRVTSVDDIARTIDDVSFRNALQSQARELNNLQVVEELADGVTFYRDASGRRLLVDTNTRNFIVEGSDMHSLMRQNGSVRAYSPEQLPDRVNSLLELTPEELAQTRSLLEARYPGGMKTVPGRTNPLRINQFDALDVGLEVRRARVAVTPVDDFAGVTVSDELLGNTYFDDTSGVVTAAPEDLATVTRAVQASPDNLRSLTITETDFTRANRALVNLDDNVRVSYTTRSGEIGEYLVRNFTPDGDGVILFDPVRNRTFAVGSSRMMNADGTLNASILRVVDDVTLNPSTTKRAAEILGNTYEENLAILRDLPTPTEEFTIMSMNDQLTFINSNQLAAVRNMPAEVVHAADDVINAAVSADNISTLATNIAANPAATRSILRRYISGQLAPVTRGLPAIARGMAAYAEQSPRLYTVMVLGGHLGRIFPDLARQINEEIIPSIIAQENLDIGEYVDTSGDRSGLGYIDSRLDISGIENAYDSEKSLIALPTEGANYTALNNGLNFNNIIGLGVKVVSRDPLIVRSFDGSEAGSSLRNGTELNLTGRTKRFRLRENRDESSPYVRYFEVANSSGEIVGLVAGTYLHRTESTPVATPSSAPVASTAPEPAPTASPEPAPEVSDTAQSRMDALASTSQLTQSVFDQNIFDARPSGNFSAKSVNLNLASNINKPAGTTLYFGRGTRIEMPTSDARAMRDNPPAFVDSSGNRLAESDLQVSPGFTNTTVTLSKDAYLPSTYTFRSGASINGVMYAYRT